MYERGEVKEGDERKLREVVSVRADCLQVA